MWLFKHFFFKLKKKSIFVGLLKIFNFFLLICTSFLTLWYDGFVLFLLLQTSLCTCYRSALGGFSHYFIKVRWVFSVLLWYYYQVSPTLGYLLWANWFCPFLWFDLFVALFLPFRTKFSSFGTCLFFWFLFSFFFRVFAFPWLLLVIKCH